MSGPTAPNWAGNTRYRGPTGATGPAGNNGISGGQVLYMDSATSTSVPTLGNLLIAPVLTAQTTINYSASSSTVLIAKFPTPVGAIPTSFIPPGLWDMNIYAATSSLTNAPSFYWSLYQVDADGVSNPVLISDGSAGPVQVTNLVASQMLYNNSLYIPATTLAAGKRLSVYLYGVYLTGARHLIFEFRADAVSHIHTTIGETAYNWSTYPATTNVNIAGFNVSGVGTLTANSIITPSVSNTGNLAITSADSNVNISAFNVISNDAFFNLSTALFGATYEVKGSTDTLSIATLNLKAAGGEYGRVQIVADGNTYVTPDPDILGVNGGLITITANTPVVTPPSIAGPILTSAVRISGEGVSVWAGDVAPGTSITGNLSLYGQLGVKIQSSAVSSSLGVTPLTVYVYGDNGTNMDGITYIKEIRNYTGNNLNIHPDSSHSVDMTRVQFIGMGNASNANLSNKVIRGDGTSILYDFGQVSSSGGDFTTLVAQSIYNSGTGIGVADLTIRAYGGLFGCNYSLNLAASCNINMNPANGGSVSINNGDLTLNSNSITGVSNFTGIGTGTVSGFSFAGLTGTGNITGFSNISNATALSITTPFLTITSNAEFSGGYLSMGNHMIDNITTAYFSGGGNIAGTSGNLIVNGAPAANLTLTNTLNTITMTQSNMTISNTIFPIVLTNGYNEWTLGVSNTDIYSGAGTATLRTSFRPIYISNGYTTLVLDSNIYASALSSNSITITNTTNSLIQNSNTALTTTGSMTISNTSNSLVQDSNTTITTSNAMTISNTTSSIVLPVTTGVVATGGTITTAFGRKFHTFTSNGTFTITNTGSATFEIMCLGGGGGGGCQSGGGGGAGGMVVFQNSLSNTSYSIVVGGGGTAGVISVSTGGNGGDSTFGTIATAYGGGGGGTYSVSGGRNGGCGGGGSEFTELAAGTGTAGTVSSGTVLSNLHYDGGVGYYAGSMGGAGGGGTAEDGGSQYGPNSIGANGGDGTAYYGTTYGAGGGAQGGGTYNPPYTDQGGVGGVGGGGDGGTSLTSGSNATGYGSGGGGGGGFTGGGGTGSAGIVIVSYPAASPLEITGSGGVLITAPTTTTTGDLVVEGALIVTGTGGGDLDMGGFNINNVGTLTTATLDATDVETTTFKGAYAVPIANPGNLVMWSASTGTLAGSYSVQIWGLTWDGATNKVGNLPHGIYSWTAWCTTNSLRSQSLVFMVSSSGPFGHQANVLDSSDSVRSYTSTSGAPTYGYLTLNNTTVGGGDTFFLQITLISSSQWDGTTSWQIY